MAHFERLVEMLRIDLAAFGKPDLDDDSDEKRLFVDRRRMAEDALRRAEGALAFASPDEPAVRVLRKLYDAVAPIILSDTKAG